MMKNIKNKSIGSILVMAVVLLAFSPFYANALTLSEVEESLTCYACPGEPLNIDRCGGGDQMRGTIKKMLAAGKTKQEILDYFEKKYGETILTIPPKRGFNLVAYIAPFVGFLIGGVIAFLLVKKWGISSGTAGKNTENTPLSHEAQEKIDDELSKLEEDD